MPLKLIQGKQLNVNLTGSFTGSFSGSFNGTGSYATQALSASYALSSSFATNALTASYISGYVSPFPYTGSAQITGSLGITGSLDVIKVGGSGYIRVGATGNTEAGYQIYNEGSLKWQIYNPISSTDLYFYDGSNNRVVFKNGGNVGIGTTTPNAKLDVNGNVIVTGSLNVSQGITGSLFGTASQAISASWAPIQVTSSYALTASYAPLYLPLTGGTINGNVTVNGTASIAFLNVQYESASVIYSSGSNVFGDATNDTQTLNGTVIVSGSQQITGSLNVSGGITGSLFGIASNVQGGIANYIPLWNTATSLSTSSIYQDGIGNLGIGTTSPNYKLDVSDIVRAQTKILAGIFTPGAATGSSTIITSGRISAGGGITFYNPANGDNQDTGFKSLSGGVISAYSANGVAVEIAGYGASTAPLLKGIIAYNPTTGTSIAKNFVEISGPINTSGTYSGGIIRGLYYNPTLTSIVGVTNHRAIETVTGDVILGSTSGNVGIGTTSPNYKLHITGSDTSGSFNADGVLIVTGSNVGIGTITPTVPLEIGRISGGTQAKLRLWSGNVQWAQLEGGDSILDYNLFGVYSAVLSRNGGQRFTVPSNSVLGWAAAIGGSSPVGANETTLSRWSAGVVAVGSGSVSNASGSLLAKTIGVGTLTPNATLDVNGNTIITGSLTVTNGITGSLFGTASYATEALSASNALTASYVLNAVSSSFATTASFAQTASFALQVSTSISTQNLQHNVLFVDTSGPGFIQVDGGLRYNPNQDLLTTTSSYTLLANTASYVQNAQSASYVLQAVSSSYALTASFAPNYQLTSSTGSMLQPYVLNTSTSSFATTGSNIFIGNQTITGSLTITGSNNLIGTKTITGSVFITGSKVIIGDNTITGSFNVSGSTTLVGNKTVTGSIFITGSKTIIGNNTVVGTAQITGSLFITGSTIVTGSLRGNVISSSIASTTASLDLATSNFFTLTLANGANTHISASNILPGQTVNIRVTQGSAGTGTVSFNSAIKQSSGSLYTGSMVANAVDMVSLIAFDQTNAYISYINNFV